MPRPKKTELCPLGGVGVGGKWKFWIWYHLLDGPKRIGALQRLIPQASRQMLTMQLRELEAVGVIHRKVYPQLPPKVEYSLTDLGCQSEPMMRQFYAWGKWCAEQMGVDFGEWMMVMSSRWLLWIWYHLVSGPKRYSELQRLLPQANRQILAVRLNDLEQMGVVHREVAAQGAKIYYSLTEMGRRSEPMLRATYAWGRWLCDQASLDFDWPLNDDSIGFTRQLPNLLDAAAWELESA